ncbi:MAG TPA: hypothetical protein VF914_19700 [Chloroflexia bacterium]
MEDEFKKAFQFGLKSAGAAYYDQVPFSFGFYGDLWRPDRRKEWEARKGTRAFRSAAAEADLIGVSIAEDILRNAGLLEKIALAPGNRGFWSGLTQLLATLDRFAPGIAGAALLQSLAADTGEYLSNETLRGLTIDRVRGKVEAAKGEVLLLAHSMGTIVCYDMLMRYPELPVRAYISFGSPLGMRAIISTVGGRRSAPFPPKLPRWINVYNQEDLVASVRLLAPLYKSEDGRQVEDLDTGRMRSPTITNLMKGHNPADYLSSLALANAARSVLEVGNNG